MASNPYVNKVKLADGTTLIDISSDTVAANKMLYGYTAHDKSGASVTGSIDYGTITRNTTGGTSSGTIDRGKQIKISAGYYANDAYYQAQGNSGTKYLNKSNDHYSVTNIDCDGFANVCVNSLKLTPNQQFQLEAEDIETIESISSLSATFGNNRKVALTMNEGSDCAVYNQGNVYCSFSSSTKGDLTAYAESTVQKVVDDGKWVTTTPTAYGTYYGKVVVSAGSILQAAFPVGALYATETSTDNPATILGFGTWTKYAPMDLTWNDTDLDWNNTVGTTDGVYVWKRTA